MGTRFSEMINAEPTFILPLDSARPEPMEGVRPSVVPQLDLSRSPQGNLRRKLRPARSIFAEPPKGAGGPPQPTKGMLIEVAVAASQSELCPSMDAEDSQHADRVRSAQM
eukprot:RCo026444